MGEGGLTPFLAVLVVLFNVGRVTAIILKVLGRSVKCQK